MKKKCVLIKGPSQYELGGFFVDELQRAFLKLNHEPIPFDARCQSYEKFCEILDDGADFIVGMNIVGFFEEGTTTQEYYEIPLIAFMLDSPVQVMRCILTASGNTFYTWIDKNHVSEMKSRFPEKPSFFMPHGGMIPKENKKMDDRLIDVLFCGTYTPDYNKAVAWIKQIDSPFVTDLFNTVLDTMLKDDTISYQDAWAKCNGPDPSQYNGLLFSIETSHRIIVREKVLESLLAAGVKITCYGNGWENSSLVTYKNFDRRPAISLQEAVDEAGNAKIFLNSSPMFKNGSHERVFTAMLGGAVCLSDENKYFKELFIDGKDILFYKPTDLSEMPRRVIELLNNPVELTAIADRAYEKTINNHTWKNRAEDIITLVDSIKNR